MSRIRLTREVLNEQRAALGLPPYTGPDEPAALRRACLETVLAAQRAGVPPARPVEQGAVRELLDRLTAVAPGRSVEVRVPPHAAVQCVEGPRHTRGTPPNVVEMNTATWIGLALGTLDWAESVNTGRVRASGPRADLSPYLPLPLPP